MRHIPVLHLMQNASVYKGQFHQHQVIELTDTAGVSVTQGSDPLLPLLLETVSVRFRPGEVRYILKSVPIPSWVREEAMRRRPHQTTLTGPQCPSITATFPAKSTLQLVRVTDSVTPACP